MSAPDTNFKKQKKRHKGPLSGMALVVIFAAILLLALTLRLVYFGNDPGDADDPAEAPVATPPAAVEDNGTVGTTD
ncbi:hypothetical protein [Roseovarius pelagicus]|uniref:Uncharacterized protein n=1 Tax=Roseovarius pelagicus TaxID=2980108 RepID=A0ABY6DCZ5_9RHOB|nr:hypothetical protein [Roseovarius pelagicus]UXX84016.1 hypothetical protein N7U68_05005 [Roseovarius pelagicus]